MEKILHDANSRGRTDAGWLKSFHTFSMGDYYNPQRMHFGALRVLNDDTVAKGMGFGKHPHQNMEIVSIPLSGDLHHQDSTGRDKIIKQGDVQIMSAGSGIAHSEMNASTEKEVKFLQIWVFPNKQNIEPRYEQKSFDAADRINKIATVVAPDNEEAVWINQDAWFSLSNLSAGVTLPYNFHKPNNGLYVFVLEGRIITSGEELGPRDGLGIWETDSIDLYAESDAELLLIEIPMQIK